MKYSFDWFFKLVLIALISSNPTFAQERPDSEILKSYGFNRLKHYTRIPNLISILKSGSMLLRQGTYAYTPNQVMFYALTEGYNLSRTVGLDIHHFSTGYSVRKEAVGGVIVRDVIETSLGMVHLVFDISALDNKRFHISPGGFSDGDGSGYGRVVPGESFRSGENLAEWLENMKTKLPGELGEIGVYEAIPVAGFLQEIWVADPVKKDLIETLKAAGQHTIAGKPIEEFIKSESFAGYFDSVELLDPKEPLKSLWRIKYPMKISVEEYDELIKKENTPLKRAGRALKRALGVCDKLLS